MPLRSAPVWLLSTLILATPCAVLAQVYKWVDEKGVVNYGDKPPTTRGKPVQPLAENGGSVSVVPGMPKEEIDQARQREMQRRVQQLEREVDELRARDYARDSAAPYSPPTDVHVSPYDYGYGYGYLRRPVYPPTAGRPDHRPDIGNSPPRPRPVRSSPLEVMPSGPAARGGRGG